MLCILCICN